MTPEDDYELRKMRRQMGEHAHIVMAMMVVIAIFVVSWLGKRADEWMKNQQPPGDSQPVQAEAK
ncbi:MAG: hypothetical protein K8U57_28075 [Planctomycetes bacterium]|nr:hypothetical protein [Planctomycetota bacterium]